MDINAGLVLQPPQEAKNGRKRRAEAFVPQPEHFDYLELGSDVPPLGKRITIALRSFHDLDRVILRSDTTSIAIPEIDLDSPASTGRFTTIRDFLQDMRAQLRQSYAGYAPGPGRDKFGATLERLDQVLCGGLPCTFVLDDPLGLARANLDYEDDDADDAEFDADDDVTVERYERTWEQRVEYGLNDAWKPAQQYVGREAGLARLVDLIRDSHKIVFLTGAGVSTESGIPAFRDNGGVMGGFTIWGKYSEKHELFQNFLAEEEAQVNYWRMHADLYAIAAHAKPNPSHHIAAHLAAQGRLLGVLTQNIDGLYLTAGLDPARLVELHGTSTRARCLTCDALYPMEATVARVAAGEPVPHCLAPGCGGVLKPDTISFGQPLVDANVTRARQWLDECDLLIVMGTSLRVAPVNKYPTISLNKRTPLVMANMEETMYDDFAEVLLNDGRCGEMMAALQDQLQRTNSVL